jgi:MoxR-like ATPase
VSDREAPSGSDLEQVQELERAYRAMQSEIGKVIIGQHEVVEQLLIALFSGGNCLLVGVPGLAKTLLISTLARILSLRFSRIQFTPDLMPSDITGTEILEEDIATATRLQVHPRAGVRERHPRRRDQPHPAEDAGGALAGDAGARGDGGRRDIRARAAVLRARDAESDRAGGHVPAAGSAARSVLFNIKVGYPTLEEERQIVDVTTRPRDTDVRPVLDGSQILHFQDLVRRVPVASHIIAYAVRLARATRPGSDDGRSLHEFVGWGAGPRAGQHMVLGAKARAALDGRPTPGIEDVRAIAHSVLRHRIVTNFNAEAEGINADQIVDRLLAEIQG